MSKDANSFGHDKALAWESRGFVYTQKRMHRFDTPSRSNKKIKLLLKKNEIADDLFGTTILILTFYVLKVFILWWIAAIIALLLAYLIDIIFKD